MVVFHTLWMAGFAHRISLLGLVLGLFRLIRMFGRMVVWSLVLVVGVRVFLRWHLVLLGHHCTSGLWTGASWS